MNWFCSKMKIYIYTSRYIKTECPQNVVICDLSVIIYSLASKTSFKFW